MVATAINLHGIRSYVLFRQAGGLTTSPLATRVLTNAYNTFVGDGVTINTPITFKDDLAAAMTPPVVLPTTGGFTSQGLQYINDHATETIFFSLDGLNDHFELKAQENIVFDFIKAQEIWLRGDAAGGQPFRLLVW